MTGAQPTGVIDLIDLSAADPSTTHTYYTHCNGSRPFMVTVRGKSVRVLTSKRMDAWEDDAKNPVPYDMLVAAFEDAERVYAPRGVLDESVYGPEWRHVGNTILIELSRRLRRYAFVGGERVVLFKAPEPVEEYHSEIGNNDVPYPVIATHNYLIFPLEWKMLPRTALPPDVDLFSEAYGYFYGHIEGCPERHREFFASKYGEWPAEPAPDTDGYVTLTPEYMRAKYDMAPMNHATDVEHTVVDLPEMARYDYESEEDGDWKDDGDSKDDGNFENDE